MYRTLLVALLTSLALPACRQMPQAPETASGAAMHSSATLMQAAAAGGSAPRSEWRYRAAIVKDLDVGGVDPKTLTGAERAQLPVIFGASFREALQREGYVRLALPGESGADVVTIQPATMRILPGRNSGGADGIAPTELEIAVGVWDARRRFVGWYAVQYSGELRDTSPVPRIEVLRRVFADAGAQVAKALATAR